MGNGNPQSFFANGLNGSTGAYLIPTMTLKQAASMIRGATADERLVRATRSWNDRKKDPAYAPMAGVDPKKLSETGWGVIFAYNADPAVRDALSELLKLREEQAGPLYKEYSGPRGYRTPGETKSEFLAQMSAGYGRVDPTKVPYYLLIVGDPETIPYSFQYELDVQYAVGRIHFDKAEDYARYAQSVVEVERKGLKLPRKAVFFNVQNNDDHPTSLSSSDLTKPLANWATGAMNGWSIEPVAPEEASKAQLKKILCGSETPALLFTSSHGLGLNPDDPRQRRHQGALVCRDWPGPVAWGGNPIPPEHYFSADDVDDSASLLGLLTFHFACYGAGTPRLNDFAVADAWRDEGAVAAFKLNARDAIAPAAFVAQLPRRLLSHPRGGALAVVGHIERPGVTPSASRTEARRSPTSRAPSKISPMVIRSARPSNRSTRSSASTRPS